MENYSYYNKDIENALLKKLDALNADYELLKLLEDKLDISLSELHMLYEAEIDDITNLCNEYPWNSKRLNFYSAFLKSIPLPTPKPINGLDT